MSILLDRRLERREHVHHVDGNGCNNHPSNLQLLRASTHTFVTHRRYPLVAWCPYCKRPFIAGGRRGHRGVCCSRSCGQRFRWLRERQLQPQRKQATDGHR